MATHEPIHVTKTFMPPLEEYMELLHEVWDSHRVTNDGPLFQRFERELRDYTDVDHVVCVGNGTLALHLGVRALEWEGEVITTPFTHVATSGSLVWERCTPVFVDIDPLTLNIDPERIPAKITRHTAGILAVPVYSNPVDFDRIEAIAAHYGVSTFYDCAHAFGARYKGRSVFAYGHLSMASFNATKGMHTMEGGALFARDVAMEKQVRKLAYYGMDESKH
ncbi:MAG: DegT/DnrJ/EryC1/StrS family aminotransferase, partial [Pseudomonadota bacterium]